MGRAPTKRFNTEFRRYFEKLADSVSQDRSDKPRDTAMQQAADLIGVSWFTVKSWLRPETGKAAAACPKWRYEMFKLALPAEVSGLSVTERKELYDRMNALYESGVMDKPAAKAFDKIEV